MLTTLGFARLEAATKEKPAAPVMTLGEAKARNLSVKEAERKRSIQDDRQNLARLVAWFGAATPLTDITASRVSEYKVARAKDKSQRRPGELISAATLNRELATLRHLLRLAVEEWQILDRLPVVRLMKEPEGRLRFLTEEQIVKLLDAAKKSQNPHLHTIITVALNTGMRRGELLGLTWERVDFSRSVILLEKTKSGKRREVPMNDATDRALSSLPGAKVEGPVFRKTNGATWGNIRTAFENAVTEAKIEDFRFHDLRHTAASHMVMRGATLAEVRECGSPGRAHEACG